MEEITIAHLTKTLGLKGEIRAYSMTDFPKERFKKGRKVFAVNPQKEIRKELTLKSIRPSGETIILTFDEINIVEEAMEIQGCDLNMDKADAVLPEGMYRLADLIGCKVYDESGNFLGEVISVLSNAPVKNLKIKKEDGKCFYCPFKDEFVPSVDVDSKKITIHVIEGML